GGRPHASSGSYGAVSNDPHATSKGRAGERARDLSTVGPDRSAATRSSSSSPPREASSSWPGHETKRASLSAPGALSSVSHGGAYAMTRPCASSTKGRSV